MYDPDEISFFNQGKIVLQTNNLPHVNDDSDGAWDRLRVVECNSRVAEGKEDERLSDKLWAESSGILNWMLEGLARYFAEGLVDVESILASTRRYRGVENHMSRFSKEECEIVFQETIKTPTSDIYDRYKYWCQKNGEVAESQRAMTAYFQRELGIKGDLPNDREKGNCLPGIRLKMSSGPDVKMD
jgi:putative DNA primase/helicase